LAFLSVSFGFLCYNNGLSMYSFLLFVLLITLCDTISTFNLIIELIQTFNVIMVYKISVFPKYGRNVLPWDTTYNTLLNPGKEM